MYIYVNINVCVSAYTGKKILQSATRQKCKQNHFKLKVAQCPFKGHVFTL